MVNATEPYNCDIIGKQIQSILHFFQIRFKYIYFFIAEEVFPFWVYSRDNLVLLTQHDHAFNDTFCKYSLIIIFKDDDLRMLSNEELFYLVKQIIFYVARQVFGYLCIQPHHLLVAA